MGNCRGLIQGEFDDWGDAGYIAPVMNTSKIANAILDLAGSRKNGREWAKPATAEVCTFYDEKNILNSIISYIRGWQKKKR